MKTRHDNNGLRKICTCGRRKWAKCDHPWHVNFKPRDLTRRNPDSKDGGYRFSLDKHLNRHIASKSEAQDEAAKIRLSIKAGTFGQPTARGDMTVGQLLDVYRESYLAVARTASLTHLGYQIGTIKRTEVAHPDGRGQLLGNWRIEDVTTDTLDRFKELRRVRGVVAVNRDLALLRAAFNWAIIKKHIKETPFKLGTETAVHLLKEHPRSRRLQGDEAASLLAACGPHLRSVVEAALETGMRRGEILSLQWAQVLGMTVDGPTVSWAPMASLFLPHGKTKTGCDRWIPISTRLKTMLDMRRFDPAGQPLPLDSYVFGTAIGGRLRGVTRAWHTAVLKSHGRVPVYVKTNLAAASRAALQAIGLHFHDLRREAGSRWQDAGVPLGTIQKWLGHANVSQTSTYLSGTAVSEHAAMARFEAHQAALQRLATEVGTGERKTLQSDTETEETLNKTAVGREPTIM